VNLIGEHTDYNDGFVLPVAIDRQAMLAARTRPDSMVHLWSESYAQGSTFDLNDITSDQERPWSNYVRGVALMLQQEGFTLRGLDCVLVGDVPIGAGLSSSAAVEVVAAYAWRALCGLKLDDPQLALVCQQAESRFVGVKCGIMDQFIAALGRAGHALLVDCRTLDYGRIPIPAGIAVMVCDTKVRRGLVESEYNRRRQECESAVHMLRRHLPEIKALRDVTSGQLQRYRDELPDTILRRCRHVVGENERVLRAVTSLRSGDVGVLGDLMRQSHDSLRDDYEVSCSELNAMVETAEATPGTIGARMTGAGFGGCAVGLVEQAVAADWMEAVRVGYRTRTGLEPDIYACRPSDGAGEVENCQRPPAYSGGDSSGRGAATGAMCA
jgi:galactokinase